MSPRNHPAASPARARSPPRYRWPTELKKYALDPRSHPRCSTQARRRRMPATRSMALALLSAMERPEEDPAAALMHAVLTLPSAAPMGLPTTQASRRDLPHRRPNGSPPSCTLPASLRPGHSGRPSEQGSCLAVACRFLAKELADAPRDRRSGAANGQAYCRPGVFESGRLPSANDVGTPHTRGQGSPPGHAWALQCAGSWRLAVDIPSLPIHCGDEHSPDGRVDRADAVRVSTTRWPHLP